MVKKLYAKTGNKTPFEKSKAEYAVHCWQAKIDNAKIKGSGDIIQLYGPDLWDSSFVNEIQVKFKDGKLIIDYEKTKEGEVWESFRLSWTDREKEVYGAGLKFNFK